MGYDKEIIIHRGLPWMLIGLVTFPQLYYLKPALLSKLNSEKHAISFSLRTQIIVPVLTVFVVVCFGALGYFRTSPGTNELADIALSVWDDLITWLAWPLSVLGMMIVFKWQSEGRA